MPLCVHVRGLACAGEVVVRLDGGVAVKLTVDEHGGASAAEVPAGSSAAAAAADVETDEMTAMRLLFGPEPPAATLPIGGMAGALLHQWCPLPLYTTPSDSV